MADDAVLCLCPPEGLIRGRADGVAFCFHGRYIVFQEQWVDGFAFPEAQCKDTKSEPHLSSFLTIR